MANFHSCTIVSSEDGIYEFNDLDCSDNDNLEQYIHELTTRRVPYNVEFASREANPDLAY